LIHEISHGFTRGPSQITPDHELSVDMSNEEFNFLRLQKESLCAPNFFDWMEGCTKGDSYENAFYHKFWREIYPENVIIQRTTDIDTAWDLFDEFDRKYLDQFVNGFATSTIQEDMAESFMAFVLWEKPTKSTILDQKILFFYDYPELVELREFIRNNFT